jgi:hypothetical protein
MDIQNIRLLRDHHTRHDVTSVPPIGLKLVSANNTASGCRAAPSPVRWKPTSVLNGHRFLFPRLSCSYILAPAFPPFCFPEAKAIMDKCHVLSWTPLSHRTVPYKRGGFISRSVSLRAAKSGLSLVSTCVGIVPFRTFIQACRGRHSQIRCLFIIRACPFWEMELPL